MVRRLGTALLAAVLSAGIATDARGQTVLTPERWPALPLAVDSTLNYLGSRTVSLGSAEAEIHALVEEGAGGVARLYWIQFEGRPAGSPYGYDYSDLPYVDSIGPFAFRSEVRFGAYSHEEKTEEVDTRTVGEIMAEHGLEFPEPMMRVRMATVDESARNEVLVIYMESLAYRDLAVADLEESSTLWQGVAADLRARAVEGLEFAVSPPLDTGSAAPSGGT